MTTQSVTRRVWVEQIMGLPISLHIRTVDPDREELNEAVAALFATLRRFDDVFSTHRADSQLMRLRRGVLPVRDAHPWLAHAHRLTDEAVSATGGLFGTELAGPDGSSGWDPTGLIKGWAVSRAVVSLQDVDSISFCCNAGGDVVCGLGRRSEQLRAPWRVGVQDPADVARVATVLEVETGAVATSGNSARGAHIVDPRIGELVEKGGSTTVVGPDLMWADIWATACFIDPDALRAAVRRDGRRWSAYRQIDVP